MLMMINALLLSSVVIFGTLIVKQSHRACIVFEVIMLPSISFVMSSSMQVNSPKLQPSVILAELDCRLDFELSQIFETL